MNSIYKQLIHTLIHRIAAYDNYIAKATIKISTLRARLVYYEARLKSMENKIC